MKNTLLFGLQYKHSGTFANRKYEELSYPQNPRNVILVTLLSENATPLYYSQSSSEKETPSSGTSPLAPYKQVPPG